MPREVYSSHGMGGRGVACVRGRPHADTVYGSRHSNMKELRAQHAGRAYRMFFAFDPDRVAIMLLGGTKNDHGRWYQRMIATADDLYDAHLARRKSEGR